MYKEIRSSLSVLDPSSNKSISSEVFKPDEPGARDYQPLFSGRQMQVIELVANGKKSQQIADLLFITEKTVGHHREVIGKRCRQIREQLGIAVGIDPNGEKPRNLITTITLLRQAGINLVGEHPDQKLEGVELLSAREREVLEIMSTGATNKYIAKRLEISNRTVGHHIENIIGKLLAGNRIAAVNRGLHLGLIKLPPPDQKSLSPSVPVSWESMRFSEMEIEICRWVAAGKTIQEIAEKTGFPIRIIERLREKIIKQTTGGDNKKRGGRNLIPAVILMLRQGISPLLPEPPDLRLIKPLSKREKEVARVAATGVTSKQIGEQLGISSKTADNHLKHVQNKLSASNRTEAVTRAFLLQLI
ncbi:MAG: LuxR C-terminal-related transcriptional regulator [bacterium]|nr:LuxR C-terminal-related transcriptional regulator [bacterium]